MSDGCICDGVDGVDGLIVHDGDCPRRCAYWQRSSHSEQIAQCDHASGHIGQHRMNLYRGSPSRRSERGLPWPIPEPDCSEPVIADHRACPYYYLEPSNACSLPRGHREPHGLGEASSYPQTMRRESP